MKYKQAVEIGGDAGLEHPWEFVNNIIIHDMNLFAYGDIPNELSELIVDAKEHGIRFSKICRHAIATDANEDKVCHMCEKTSREVVSGRLEGLVILSYEEALKDAGVPQNYPFLSSGYCEDLVNYIKSFKDRLDKIMELAKKYRNDIREMLDKMEDGK